MEIGLIMWGIHCQKEVTSGMRKANETPTQGNSFIWKFNPEAPAWKQTLPILPGSRIQWPCGICFNMSVCTPGLPPINCVVTIQNASSKLLRQPRFCYNLTGRESSKLLSELEHCFCFYFPVMTKLIKEYSFQNVGGVKVRKKSSKVHDQKELF